MKQMQQWVDYLVSFLPIEPSSAFLIAVAGACLAAILVAIYGVRTRREDSATRAKLADLESKINHLLLIEERRFFAELKKDLESSENTVIPWQRHNPRRRIIESPPAEPSRAAKE
jgi:hypothetical protein